jgi:leader peptidase (prepilin peptidase)/N-methyltransferase
MKLEAEEMVRALGTLFAALAGLAVGSFLNVCLSRWPEGESVVKPRSHCRSCARTLAWWENVPLVSWIALRGRCRTCGSWIGWRYPIVELAVGALWAIVACRFLSTATNPNISALSAYILLVNAAGKAILCWLLVALAVLDAENLWLPDWLTLPGIALGFICTVLRERLSYELRTDSSLKPPLLSDALGFVLGILAAAALILVIRWLYWLFRRREGIGLGDAKLMAMLAACLGLPGALLSFGLGVTLGALVALILLVIPSKGNQSADNPETWALTKLPLGTFLSVGGIISSLSGQRIIDAYLRWAGF